MSVETQPDLREAVSFYVESMRELPDWHKMKIVIGTILPDSYVDEELIKKEYISGKPIKNILMEIFNVEVL